MTNFERPPEFFSTLLDDYSGLELCLVGPEGGLAIGCECFDFNADNDVDTEDYAAFQRSFRGP